MWIDLPQFSASIVAHKTRDDLLLIRFRTCTDANGFLKMIDPQVPEDDIEQRKAFVYGMTPGERDYPYRIMLRRAYFSIFLFAFASEFNYRNFKEEAHKRGPSGMMGRIRGAYLSRKWQIGLEYEEAAWNNCENLKAESTPRPVYEPAQLQEGWDNKWKKEETESSM